MKTNFWGMLLGIATLAVVGCAKEPTIDGVNGQTGIKDHIGYLAFKLSNTPGTRADEPVFDKGEANESAVTLELGANRVIMFDENGNYFGSSLLGTLSQIVEGNHESDHYPDGGIVADDGKYGDTETLYADVAVYTKKENNIMPGSLLVVLNANPVRLSKLINMLEVDASTDGSALKKTMQLISHDEAYDEEAAYYTSNGVTYFTMTSSVFVDETGKFYAATPVTKDDIKTNAAEAAKNPVIVFVERIAAKFTLALKENDTEETFGDNAAHILTPSGDGIKVNYQKGFNGNLSPSQTSWYVNVANWAVNALEPHTFLFKNFADNNSAATVPAADFYDSWNAWWYHRSYWAVDQHYLQDDDNYVFGTDRSIVKYPDQYRKAYDKEVTNYDPKTVYDNGYNGEYGYDKDAWSLNYISFNEIGTRAANRYSLENTFADNFEDGGYLRAGTHILVAAQLILEGFDDVNVATATPNAANNYMIDGVKDKYFASNIFWDADGYLNFAYQEFAHSMATGRNCDHIFGTGRLYFPKNDGKIYADETLSTEITLDNLSNYFEIKPAYIKGGDGWVTIGLKNNVSIYLKVAAGAKVETEPSAEDDSTDYTTALKLDPAYVCSAVYAFADGAKHFSEGRMYYALPIKHNAQYNAAFDASEPVVGDFGVVRNHWYKLNITDVQKIGTPVDDPDQPIIPNDEPEQNAIGLEIVVLPWHVIGEDVIL